jgi:hypothetical protein
MHSQLYCTNGFYPPPPLPSQRDLKLDVNLEYGNLKLELARLCPETSTKLYVHEFTSGHPEKLCEIRIMAGTVPAIFRVVRCRKESVDNFAFVLNIYICRKNKFSKMDRVRDKYLQRGKVRYFIK